MKEVVLEFRDLWKSFYQNGAEKQVLKGANLKVFRGDLLCVLGESGGGKSVLMEHMNRNNTPDRGEIYLFGENLLEADPERFNELIKRTGYVFQRNALFKSLTVHENLVLWFEEHKDEKDDEKLQAIVEKALREVDLDVNISRYMPSQLSGGMQKRLAIARTIAYEPEIIVYDEPTVGLPEKTIKRITKLIRELHNKGGRTSIVVTHDLDSVEALEGRIALVYDGVVHCFDSYDEFRRSDCDAVLKYSGKYKGEEE